MALTTLPERPQEQTEKPDPVETLKKSFSDRIKGLLTENTVVQTIKGYWNRISSLFSSSKTEKTSAPETKEVTSPIESLQQSVQEQVKETLPNPFKQAEKLEKQHVDQMAQQFGRLMNEYRESSAKIEQPTDFIPLRKPQLTENDELSQLAAQIADG
ncbi:MAG: hypothetical protein U1C97_02545, partial [Candidatus Gracilibacteria bacterium]|nr:hypothetical protein [Candidatus Gracilibacteria bacterium]